MGRVTLYVKGFGVVLFGLIWFGHIGALRGASTIGVIGGVVTGTRFVGQVGNVFYVYLILFNFLRLHFRVNCGHGFNDKGRGTNNSYTHNCNCNSLLGFGEVSI